MCLFHKISLFSLTLLCSLSVGSSSTGRCEANPAYYDFEIGDIKATVVSDGKLFFPAALFIKNILPLAVDRAFTKNFIEVKPALAVDNNILYLRTSKRQILIDAGSSNFFQPTAGRLFRNLKDAGIRRRDIDAVILTHAHVDHLGGLLTPKGALAFPNAEVYIDEDEYRFWTTDPVDLSTTVLTQDFKDLLINTAQTVLRAVKKKIRTFRDGDSIFPEILAIRTPGHTPAHTCFLIESKGQHLFVTGDLIGAKPSFSNPEWEFIQDTNSTQSVEQRYRVLDRLSKEEIPLQIYHAPWPGLGNAQQLKAAFDFLPAGGIIQAGVRKNC